MFSLLTLELVAELRRNCGNQTHLQSLQSMFNLTAPSPTPHPKCHNGTSRLAYSSNQETTKTKPTRTPPKQ